MKTAYKSIAFAAFVAASMGAMASGTEVEDSTLANTSLNSQNLNLSIGVETLASTGSINVRNGAEVEDSTVLNASANGQNLNISVGDHSTASTGSTTIE
jgi:hypothetical protein